MDTPDYAHKLADKALGRKTGEEGKKRKASVVSDSDRATKDLKRAAELVKATTQMIEKLSAKYSDEAIKLAEEMRESREDLIKTVVGVWFSHNFASQSPNLRFSREGAVPSEDKTRTKRRRVSTITGGEIQTTITLPPNSSEESRSSISRGSLRNAINEYLSTMGLPGIGRNHELWTKWLAREYIGIGDAEWRSGKEIQLSDYRSLAQFQETLRNLLDLSQQEKLENESFP